MNMSALVVPEQVDDLDVITHRLVADLQRARPGVFWADLLTSAFVGWGAFAAALAVPAWSVWMFVSMGVSAFALYRCLCFIHEIVHLRRGSISGFETAWNLVVGVPLLLPTFVYHGVHQAHHSLSTYGTKDDPEYLPLASSRGLLIGFAIQSSLLLPLLLLFRFIVLAPLGFLWPRFHRWLEQHASAFSMNPKYHRVMRPALVQTMRQWEAVIFIAWVALLGMMARGTLPWRLLALWVGVFVVINFVNTLRVLGAHDYESDGTPRNRQGQLIDSIDTPGGLWTELWAPVGLRYHALHHYFPGIPYHNLGIAYRRIVAADAAAAYRECSSPGLTHSLGELYGKASRAR